VNHILQRILKRKELLLKLVIPSISLAIAVILLGTAFSFHFSPFSPVEQLPTLTGDHRASIRVDLFTEGLSYPTSLAFVDNTTLLADVLSPHYDQLVLARALENVLIVVYTSYYLLYKIEHSINT